MMAPRSLLGSAAMTPAGRYPISRSGCVMSGLSAQSCTQSELNAAATSDSDSRARTTYLQRGTTTDTHTVVDRIPRRHCSYVDPAVSRAAKQSWYVPPPDQGGGIHVTRVLPSLPESVAFASIAPAGMVMFPRRPSAETVSATAGSRTEMSNEYSRPIIHVKTSPCIGARNTGASSSRMNTSMHPGAVRSPVGAPPTNCIALKQMATCIASPTHGLSHRS
mmetsp:Transcript_17225/g.41469  ORF Transcript_17225/g.41469 Transcript_17225/m.41469 type:complete len:220 (-) Transcript_17225:1083-1742(-)